MTAEIECITYNPNQELLDWAVENITEWGEEWTHLRSSCQHTILTKGGSWYTDFTHHWQTNCGTSKTYYVKTGTKIPQVITREEWLASLPEKPLKLSYEQLVRGLTSTDLFPITLYTIKDVYDKNDPKALEQEIISLKEELQSKELKLESLRAN